MGVVAPLQAWLDAETFPRRLEGVRVLVVRLVGPSAPAPPLGCGRVWVWWGPPPSPPWLFSPCLCPGQGLSPRPAEVAHPVPPRPLADPRRGLVQLPPTAWVALPLLEVQLVALLLVLLLLVVVLLLPLSPAVLLVQVLQVLVLVQEDGALLLLGGHCPGGMGTWVRGPPTGQREGTTESVVATGRADWASTGPPCGGTWAWGPLGQGAVEGALPPAWLLP